MPDQIIAQDIEFFSHIGIEEQERRALQPIRVDVELDYPVGAFMAAADTDEIIKAIDYAKVVERIISVGTSAEFRLLERLAEQIVQTLLAEFAVVGVKLWIRKAVPPLKDVHNAVGVRVTRARADLQVDPKPADFLIQSINFLHKGTVLDLAAGRGRNTLYLAGLGFAVDAVDRDEEALMELAAMAKQRQLPHIGIHTIDLENNAAHPPPLTDERYHDRYDTVVVFFYLHRPLFPALMKALKPGGVLVYETFLIDNHLHYQHPRRKEFCLEHNELLRLTGGLRVLHYEEGPHEGTHGQDRAFTARLVAQKGQRG